MYSSVKARDIPMLESTSFMGAAVPLAELGGNSLLACRQRKSRPPLSNLWPKLSFIVFI